MLPSTPTRIRTWLLPSCLALAFTACGGPEREPVAVPVAPAEGRVPRPAPPRAKTDRELLLEACIEKKVHAPSYDARSPQDARRRMRWLQVKADCEQQIASR